MIFALYVRQKHADASQNILVVTQEHVEDIYVAIDLFEQQFIGMDFLQKYIEAEDLDWLTKQSKQVDNFSNILFIEVPEKYMQKRSSYQPSLFDS